MIPLTSDYQQAREFLECAVPWPDDGAPGYVDIISSYQKPGEDRLFWGGRATRSLDEAINAIAWLRKQPDTKGIYVCTSLQATAKQKRGKNGYEYFTPIRNQAGALALKSLFIDVDIKDGPNGYPTEKEAVKAINEFLVAASLPKPNVIVNTGGGLHCWWVMSRALKRDEWQPLSDALYEAIKRHGLRCDAGCTTDSARIMRVPDTVNRKYAVERPVRLIGRRALYDPAVIERALQPYKIVLARISGFAVPHAFATVPDHLKGLPVENELGAGIERPEYPPMTADQLRACTDAIPNPIDADWQVWNTMAMRLYVSCNGAPYGLDVLKDWTAKNPARSSAKDMAGCDEVWQRFHEYPPAQTNGGALINEARRALNDPKWLPPRTQVLPSRVTLAAEPPSFADPWADFVGPPFPLQTLPSTLASFVQAQHEAMGADPAALAMAALTAVAGAMNAEMKIKMGEGWTQQPILWTALIGPPSTLKTPILQKATAPLCKIDHQNDAAWRQQKSVWNQTKATPAPNPGPCPPKPARLVIHDSTAEKVAEILSRAPAGSLMVHDELAGWIGSFERYSNGLSSRGFFLQSWNGGLFLKDRVGKGSHDDQAEIRVDNLALCVLGGIQPDKLCELRDLTSDGLLQRLLPVLMRLPDRGNESHPVSAAESEYEKLIGSLHRAVPRTYVFEPDAMKVRKRVLDRLYVLEQSQGFSSALIGAIGKLKGYYGRLALVLHVAAEHIKLQGNAFGAGGPVPHEIAEAAEQLLFDFVLPHTFGLYDVIANGGQERDTVRNIASFILASDKDRLRPCDFVAGVRRLRGEPQHKIAEWASRFVAMGWLRPEDENTMIPKAWLVVQGLRQHFAERREQVRAARAEAHAILKAGGTRR